MIFTNFLRTKKRYMLLVIPFLFIVLVLVFREFPKHLSQPIIFTDNLLHIGFLDRLALENSVWVKGSLLLISAYLIISVTLRYKLLSQETCLPGILYICLTAGTLWESSDIFLLLAVIFTTLAFINLQGAIHNSYSVTNVFNVGFFTLLALLFYPKLIFLLVWAFVALFLSGRSSLRDVIALFFGFATVIFFFVFYCFWTNSLQDILPSIERLITMEGKSFHFSDAIWLSIGILVFIFICSLGVMLGYYSGAIVNQRKSMTDFVLSFFILLSTSFLMPGMGNDVFYVLAIPLSYYFSQYFILQGAGYWADFQFLLFLAACGLLYWHGDILSLNDFF